MNTKRNRPESIRFLMIYTQRWWLTNVTYFFKNMISSALVFLMTCYAVRKDAFDLMEPTKSCLFAVLMCTIWSGLFNSIAMFYNESDYTMDELTKVLPVRVYVFANVLVQGLLCLAEALASVVIFRIFFHFPGHKMVTPLISIDYTITFFLILFSADMLGFAVGVLVDNITTAMTLIPIVLIVQFLFSGCLFDLDGVLKFFSRFTTARWGYSALGSLADLNNMKSRFAEIIPNYVPSPNDLFKGSASFVRQCWLFMLIIAVVAIMIEALLLIWKLNKQ